VHDSDNALERVSDLLESHGFALTIESDSEMANTNLYSVFAIRDPQSKAVPLPTLNTDRWGGIAHLKRQTLARLKASQPDYMVPAHLVFLQQLPLTPNGKLDRKALPAPDASAHRHRVYAAPLSDTEKAIAAIWQDLLAVEKIGRHDSFFGLGGHSLLAMQFMTKVQATFALQLQLRTLFECPTIERFAASVDLLLKARNQLSAVNEESNEARQVGAL
jgi:acyl carrier protein